jgi:hypothetical protein
MACHDIQERSKLEKGVHLKQHTLESLNLHELGSHKSQLSIDGLFRTPLFIGLDQIQKSGEGQ